MAPMTERDPEKARAAHLLRRCVLRVDHAQIDEYAAMSWDDGVSALLAGAAEQPSGRPPSTDDWGDVAEWWMEQMAAPGSGLRDRMAWFWHTLLTTNAWKVSEADLIGAQLTDLRADAMGDYRTLLHHFVGSGALLEYLDASRSMAANPNENLARELMELFTLGRGNYTEDDVRSAARALAGWVVEDGEVTWKRENAFLAPLLFRGVQDEWDLTKVVDHLCDQPETAAHVGSRVWRHLVGTELSPDEAATLGAWWQGQELSISALVERILGEPAMEQSRLARPRSGLEWYVAYRSVSGAEADGPWQLEGLGQVPYLPPNVGGWPEGERWLSPGSMLSRASLAFAVDLETLAGGESGTTSEILDRCGLFEVSPATVDALDAVRSSDELPPEAAYLTKWRLALASPEFSLS